MTEKLTIWETVNTTAHIGLSHLSLRVIQRSIDSIIEKIFLKKSNMVQDTKLLYEILWMFDFSTVPFLHCNRIIDTLADRIANKGWYL